MSASQYISLADLQAMEPNVLYHRWVEGLFPFDYADGCHMCVTQHDWHSKWSGDCSHTELRASADGMRFTGYGVDLQQHLERIYALRLFYRDLYVLNPPELDTIPKESIAIQIEKENEYAVKA